MITVKEIYWIAGIIEGEGCFTTSIRKNRNFSPSMIRLSLQTTDLDVAEKLAKHLKCSVNSHKSSLEYKTKYSIEISSYRAISWMFTLYSLMSCRRRARIRELIKMWKSCEILRKDETYARGII